MALTKRQNKLYKDTVNVWHYPGQDGAILDNDENDVVTNLLYAAVNAPDITALKCDLQTQLEGNKFEPPLGRTAFDNIFTLDKLFCEAGTALEDQDVVKLTTAGSSLLNQWFICQGEGKERDSDGVRSANYKMVQLKRTNAPPTAEIPEFGLGFGLGFS